MGGWLNTAVRFFRNWIFQRWKIQCKNNKQITDRIDSIQNRQQQEKILQKSADKHLFQCYRVKHGRKSCRQQNNPKRTMKSNEGALRPNNGRSAPFGAL